MVVIEHNGIEYALVSTSGKFQWVNERNQVIPKELSDELHTIASFNGFNKPLAEPAKFQLLIDTSVKQKKRRPRKNKNGISINIDIKHDWRK